MNKTSRTLFSLGLLSAAVFGVSQQANAHGYVESPASRAYQCKLQLNTQCGSVQYEPQSVEGLKGFRRPARLTATSPAPTSPPSSNWISKRRRAGTSST